MSGWDWIHAGLELATYTQAQKAQQELGAMRTATEIEAARRLVHEAMKNFIFDISRDIKLAEEQLTVSPQQVYIVSRCLKWRMDDSGLSAEMFPGFDEKEYVHNTQRKITEVIGKSKASLTEQNIQQSEIAIQYLIEMPLLGEAITVRNAQESLRLTNDHWQKLSSQAGSKKFLTVISIIALIMSFCIGGPLLLLNLGFIASEQTENKIIGFLITAIIIGIPIISIVLLIISQKKDPDYAPLQANRETWRKQMVTNEEWQKIVAVLGDNTLDGYQRMYAERVSFLSPLLGGDFEKYLMPGQ